MWQLVIMVWVFVVFCMLIISSWVSLLWGDSSVGIFVGLVQFWGMGMVIGVVGDVLEVVDDLVGVLLWLQVIINVVVVVSIVSVCGKVIWICCYGGVYVLGWGLGLCFC